MLALTFFAFVFSTVFWLIYAGLFVADKLQGVDLMELGLMDASVYTAFILLPLFFLWSAFGHVNQYIINRNVHGNLSSLMKQIKKSMDYTDLVARILLEAEQEIKDGFILNKFDIFIADMNEVLSEIIRRCSIASSEQIENLWTKVQNGGKWSFGKVIIEVSQNQSDFAQRTVNRARNDVVLAGSLLEFAARYQSLISLLERHDKEHVFLNMVETGVFGKTYSIISPIEEEVKRSRKNASSVQNSDVSLSSYKEDSLSASAPEPENNSADIIVSNLKAERRKTETSPTFVSKLNVFRKKLNDAEKSPNAQAKASEKDPFTIALERSFGATGDSSVTSNQAEPKKETPILSIRPEDRKNADWHEDNQLDIEDFTGHVNNNRKPSNVKEFSETRKTLNSLRKEWENQKVSVIPARQEAVAEETMISPFSNWTDEIIEKR